MNFNIPIACIRHHKPTGYLAIVKGRENWLKMNFESLFDAAKMIPMPGPNKEYHP
jgi:hypothetical protein